MKQITIEALSYALGMVAASLLQSADGIGTVRRFNATRP